MGHELGMQCAYELARLERIAHNKRKLTDLGLEHVTVTTTLHTRPRTVERKERKRSQRTRPAQSHPLRRSGRVVKPTVVSPVIDQKQPDPPRNGNAMVKRSKPARKQTAAPRGVGGVGQGHDQLPECAMGLSDEEIKAFLVLREWKRQRGRELGYSNPCVICHNRTLCEMVQILPRNEDELLSVWGINPRRLEQHGAGMLQALEPFRGVLEQQHHKRADEDVKLGGGAKLSQDRRPHPHWVAEQKRAGLPTCAWEQRRCWCASEYGCRACESHGPEGSWAVQSQALLNRLEAVYGSFSQCEESGWRWFASPNHSQLSHNHQWWPPLTICEEYGLRKMPLGTTSARALLDRMVAAGGA